MKESDLPDLTQLTGGDDSAEPDLPDLTQLTGGGRFGRARSTRIGTIDTIDRDGVPISKSHCQN